MLSCSLFIVKRVHQAVDYQNQVKNSKYEIKQIKS